MKIVIETDSQDLVSGLAGALLVHKRGSHTLKISLEFADAETTLADPLVRASLVGGGDDLEEAEQWLAGLERKAG